MAEYTPNYCTKCAQLRMPDFLTKPCQFCGNTTFATVRPVPTFTAIDKRQLRTMKISPGDSKEKT